GCARLLRARPGGRPVLPRRFARPWRRRRRAPWPAAARAARSSSAAGRPCPRPGPAPPGSTGATGLPPPCAPRPRPAAARLPAARESPWAPPRRSEEHTSELQSLTNIVCRLLLEKKKKHEQLNTHTLYTNDSSASQDTLHV